MVKSGTVATACMLALCLVRATSAFAQTDPSQSPASPTAQPQPPPQKDESRPIGQLRLGPLTATPLFTLRDLGIDNNVFDTADDRKADFTGTAVPGATLELELGRLRFQTTGDLGLVYYSRYKSERAVNRSLDGLAEMRLGRRLLLFGGGSYVNTKTRMGQELDVRAHRRIRSTNGGLTFNLSKKTELELSSTQSEILYADDAVFYGVRLQQTLNQKRNVASGKVRYTLTPFTTLELTAGNGTERYEYFKEKNNDFTDVMMTAAFKPRAFVAGTAMIGYRHTRPSSAAMPPFRGTIADLTLVKRLGEATELGVLFGRATGATFELGSPYYVQNRYGVSLRRHLFRRAEALVSGEWQSRDYTRFLTPVLDVPALEGKDRTSIYTGIFRVNLTRRMRVSWYALSTQHGAARSHLRGYDGFRSGFLLSYGVFTVGNRTETGGFQPW